jgi:polyhydroxybutyrate depolymerase
MSIVSSISKIVLSGLFLFVIVVIIGFFILSNRDRALVFQKQRTITVGSIRRKYLISLPVSTTVPKYIIIGLHGFGDSPRKFAYYTALHNVASDDTVVVYPSAVASTSKNMKTGWNAGFCCGSGWKTGADDVGFIQKLAEEVSSKYRIENKNIYLVGFSNGAFMAQRFAIENPGSIGGIVASSGTLGTKTNILLPKLPMPILLLHGKNDKTIPIIGGTAAGSPGFDWLPYTDTVALWKQNNGYSAQTKSIIYPNDGHIWHGWRILNMWHGRPSASIESIKFLKGL